MIARAIDASNATAPISPPTRTPASVTLNAVGSAGERVAHEQRRKRHERTAEQPGREHREQRAAQRAVGDHGAHPGERVAAIERDDPWRGRAAGSTPRPR